MRDRVIRIQSRRRECVAFKKLVPFRSPPIVRNDCSCQNVTKESIFTIMTQDLRKSKLRARRVKSMMHYRRSKAEIE